MQACTALPQTGMVDEDTWAALLGPSSKPSDIDNLFSDDGNDTDMLQEHGGVWLLGEQRWARKNY